jgi:Zn-dependent oligopeptidase
VHFAENVAAAERAWGKHVADGTCLHALSPTILERAYGEATARGLQGAWLTLDADVVRDVMRRVEDRAVRFAVFEAHSTRASDRGPHAAQFDNGPIVDEILALRYERARLLGFRNSAELTVEGSGDSPDGLERRLLERNAEVRPLALDELGRLWAQAKASHGLKAIRPWDLAFYAEALGLGADAAIAAAAAIERELFDLRMHRDFVPARMSSKLRSQVFDTLAQVRKEVAVLASPPWDRSACGFLEVFGGAPRGRPSTGVET